MVREDSADRELRMVLDRATAELPPLPDLVPGAVRQGRRRRLRSRAVLGAAVLGSVAAVAVPTLLLAPLGGGSETTGAGSSQSTGELPLVPANWPANQPLAAPTKAYPTVQVTETAKPGDRTKPPKLTREQTELRYAFKQKVADVLSKLLPANAGEIRVPLDGPQDYLLVSGDKTYTITFRVDVPPADAANAAPSQRPSVGRDGGSPAGQPNGSCAEMSVGQGSKISEIGCTEGKLPDGTPISVFGRSSVREGTVGPATPTTVFNYHEVGVALALLADAKSNTAPAVSNEQLVKVVTDSTFLQLVDFWKVNRLGR
ncbi:hypothetical protein [Embleya sp. AB8]|uniref:hypothetical protein n=1 Tax=Embleya sp. AB8 TaxID=3156304 RepID=UPI003C75D37D